MAAPHTEDLEKGRKLYQMSNAARVLGRHANGCRRRTPPYPQLISWTDFENYVLWVYCCWWGQPDGCLRMQRCMQNMAEAPCTKAIPMTCTGHWNGIWNCGIWRRVWAILAHLEGCALINAKGQVVQRLEKGHRWREFSVLWSYRPRSIIWSTTLAIQTHGAAINGDPRPFPASKHREWLPNNFFYWITWSVDIWFG